ncbi:MAG: chemotaxis protein CheD [Cellvibrio sp.]|nr:chemotaxis protein CheD [Cellvibrio sp.]
MIDSLAKRKEFFLQPGEFYFGGGNVRLRTLLGSCVAIVIWHPRLCIGGMCHYLLPYGDKPYSHSDTRYAQCAINQFLRQLKKNATHPSDYVVKIFGGGKMFEQVHTNLNDALDVGQRNVDVGKKLLAENGFIVAAEHIAGKGHRNVIFDIPTGDIWVKHVSEFPKW